MGDSGWVHFQIDGGDVDNEYTEYLVDMMYGQLDYGSWAGEFTASGEAIFDADESAFVGTDYYSEEETSEISCNIEVKVPKTLWFDVLSLQLSQDNADDDISVEARFSVKNGYLTNGHEMYEHTLENDLKDKIDNVTDKFNRDNRYSGMWNNITIQKSEFKEVDEYYVHVIESIRVRTEDTDEKDIYLQVDEDEFLPELNS